MSAASGSDTLFAFLSTGCLTCQTFWDGLRPGVRQPMPGGARVIVVVKDPAFESPSKLATLAPPDVPVIQSSQAWEDFGVQMSPYFCFVDGRSGDGALGGRGDELGPGVVAADRRAVRRGGGAREGERMSPIVAVGLAIAIVAGLRSTWSP